MMKCKVETCQRMGRNKSGPSYCKACSSQASKRAKKLRQLRGEDIEPSKKRSKEFAPVRNVSDSELLSYSEMLDKITYNFTRRANQIDKNTPFQNSSWVYDDARQLATIVLWKCLASHSLEEKPNNFQVAYHVKQYLYNEYQKNLADCRAPHAKFTHPDFAESIFSGSYGRQSD